MTRVPALLIATVVSGSALAADKGATLSLNLPVLSYSSTDSKRKPDGGAEQKETTTALDTANVDEGYMTVGFGSAVVYLWYPFSDAKKVRGGYKINDMLEAGLTLGFNTSKEKESKAEDNSSRYGLYVMATPKLGPAALEATLAFDATSRKGKTVTPASGTTPATTANVEESGTEVQLDVVSLFPLTSNLSYGAGLWYKMSSNDVKKPAKYKDTANQFGLTLASLRLEVN